MRLWFSVEKPINGAVNKRASGVRNQSIIFIILWFLFFDLRVEQLRVARCTPYRTRYTWNVHARLPPRRRRGAKAYYREKLKHLGRCIGGKSVLRITGRKVILPFPLAARGKKNSRRKKRVEKKKKPRAPSQQTLIWSGPCRYIYAYSVMSCRGYGRGRGELNAH